MMLGDLDILCSLSLVVGSSTCSITAPSETYICFVLTFVHLQLYLPTRIRMRVSSTESKSQAQSFVASGSFGLDDPLIFCPCSPSFALFRVCAVDRLADRCIV
ncbi:hypothetical protein OH77DRAFT_318884 [Trametes cingulata]|nr:hypothetical protein OH77DRAFT_318884 [Trametes cingulata]